MAAKLPDQLSYVDKLRDEAIEIRTKTLDYLEGQIEKQEMDVIEAFGRLKSICLFDSVMASNYIKGISNKQKLWRLHVIN